MNPSHTRRQMLIAGGASFTVLATSGASAFAADAYPAKPIKLIVPFPPGGPTDIMGRIAAQLLTDKLPGTVVVENKPGAGGNIGTDAVAKAAPDGYTLALAAVSSLAIAPALYPKLPYNVDKDLTPIMLVGMAKGAIVAHPSAPFNDLKGLVAYAKANPGKLSYGSSGIGTANHLAGEMLAQTAGIQLVHVPYKGTSALSQDLLGGQIPLAVESSLTSAAPNVKDGRLKAIAITSSSRSSLLPDVPTVAEQGYPGFDVPTWFGIVGPAGLPRPIVEAIHKALDSGLRAPAVAEQFARIGADPTPDTPAEFAAYMKSQQALWTKVVRDADVKLD